MKIGGMDSIVDIAVSGLRAQAKRMDVAASNIANVKTTRTETGEPYRRKSLVLSTMMDDLAGVEIVEVASDMTTDFKRIHEPGHPDADLNGFVNMPNVELPVEMVQMMTASRAYQANAAVLKRYQDNMNITMELLR
jgi:flagellar basal-body rod protein FlgC